MSTQAIAAQLKKAIHQAVNDGKILSSHPFMDATDEDKMKYLKLVSLILHAGDELKEKEEAFFKEIFRCLHNSNEKAHDSLIAEMIGNAKNPDLSDMSAIMATIAKEEAYKSALILDAVVLANLDSTCSEEENEVIEQFREIVGWSKKKFENVREIADYIASNRSTRNPLTGKKSPWYCVAQMVDDTVESKGLFSFFGRAISDLSDTFPSMNFDLFDGYEKTIMEYMGKRTQD